MLTINMALLVEICSGIAIVCGAIGIIAKSIKKIMTPVLEPMKNITEKQEFVEECLDKDKKRLDILEDSVDQNTKSINMLLKVNLAILEHLETGNATKKMSKTRKDLEQFLINK